MKLRTLCQIEKPPRAAMPCRTCLKLLAFTAPILALALQPGAAQTCDPRWTDQFPAGELDGPVRSLAVLDGDGDGTSHPVLLVGGRFTVAGPVLANNIARWDGADWSALGDGTNDIVLTLLVHDDDGDGPAAPAVYAGGRFTTAGRLNANRVAKWDGTSWSPLSTGVSGAANAEVRTLVVYDADGSGPTPPFLYAGGSFSSVGAEAAQHIARWNGEAWSSIGGANGGVNALTVWESGAGLAGSVLCIGGSFTLIGDVFAMRIVTFDGTSFAPLGLGMDPQVSPLGPAVAAIAALDDDDEPTTPPALYAGGSFTNAGDVVAARVARWDGTSSGVGSGINNSVRAIAVGDLDGPGIEPVTLFVGGNLTAAGDVLVGQLAGWNGSEWSPLTSASANGINGSVAALTTLDEDGDGPGASVIYAAGYFTHAGTIGARSIARWNGQTWAALGEGLALPFSPYVSGIVYALAASEAGPSGQPVLYATGLFGAAGGVSAQSVAQWDGATWSPLGTGISPSAYAAAIFDADGSGPDLPSLYVGGQLTWAGGVPASRIAKWDGATWSALGSGQHSNGVSSEVEALATLDEDGEGPLPPALYVGGRFVVAGAGLIVNRIARWNGSVWSALGSGIPGSSTDKVLAITVFDDDGSGSNPAMLYAGGSFSAGQGAPGNYLAKWDGLSWSPLSSEVNGTVVALASFDQDGSGPGNPRLYALGAFTTAGELVPVAGAAVAPKNTRKKPDFVKGASCLERLSW